MQIEKFTVEDINEATSLAVEAWGDALAEWKPAVARTVCEYSVRDEFRNENLSLKITDGGIMKGYLLAATATDKNMADDWLRKQFLHFTEKEDFDIFDMVMNASNKNNMRVVRHLGEKDVMLTFFLSVQPGCGKMLLGEMMKLLHERGFENCYLWTDVTCNHQYYPKHGFELVEEVCLRESSDEQPFIVYVYKKKIL